MTDSNHLQQEYQTHLAQDRFGLQVATRLSRSLNDVPHDVSERLRVARLQALSKRKMVTARTVTRVMTSGSSAALSFDDENFSLWDRIAAAIPLIALIIGLVAINLVQNDSRAREVAEIDAALLTDDLPPTAYTDPGFVQFLKVTREQTP